MPTGGSYQTAEDSYPAPHPQGYTKNAFAIFPEMPDFFACDLSFLQEGHQNQIVHTHLFLPHNEHTSAVSFVVKNTQIHIATDHTSCF